MKGKKKEWERRSEGKEWKNMKGKKAKERQRDLTRDGIRDSYLRPSLRKLERQQVFEILNRNQCAILRIRIIQMTGRHWARLMCGVV